MDYKTTKRKKFTEDVNSLKSDSMNIEETKDNNKRSTREKKPNVIEDIGYIEKANSGIRPKTSFTIELHKKCEKILLKLKRHQFAYVLVNQNDYHVDVQNFAKIEKSLKNHLYTSVSQFGNDIRLSKYLCS